MKPVRLTSHASLDLADREIELDEVNATLAKPDSVASELPGRRILMCRYFDESLEQ